MMLIYTKNNSPVYVGDIVLLNDDEEFEITSITEPHKPSSTGRVNGRLRGADHEISYFPSVIGAVWINREDQEDQDGD